MYKVKRYFRDLQDGNHAYNEGDKFPRPEHEVSEERIAELASAANKQGTPLIEFCEESPVKTYTEDDLATMTKGEIKAAAGELGFKLTGISKAEVVSEFLELQGN